MSKKRSGAVVKGRIKDEKMLAREKKCFSKAKSEPKQEKQNENGYRNGREREEEKNTPLHGAGESNKRFFLGHKIDFVN